MIQQTIKTTTGKLSIAIPADISEVTLGQIIQMQESTAMSDLEAIHYLSGVSLNDLHNIKNFADVQVFNKHVTRLSAQIKECYNSDSIPKNITFKLKGVLKTVRVISNLAIEPAGAFLAARDVITDEISKHIEEFGEDEWKVNFNPSLRSCALILAHYFYCPVTGKKYSEHEAEQFVGIVNQLPFADALPVAKYFFLSYPNLLKPKISFWQRVQLCWRKRLELNPFRNSGMLTPLMP